MDFPRQVAFVRRIRWPGPPVEGAFRAVVDEVKVMLTLASEVCQLCLSDARNAYPMPHLAIHSVKLFVRTSGHYAGQSGRLGWFPIGTGTVFTSFEAFERWILMYSDIL